MCSRRTDEPEFRFDRVEAETNFENLFEFVLSWPFKLLVLRRLF